ncbi:hypothetical protein AMATHDRAFT_70381 [Amanita thiersii Skay4041]|uniref:Uncharacterized protein n=1 Tax=Amanita thiersii Skay4041 TaxID=703135 RepID=A0A2A9ND72_9AGAR|nr:hypothetical protein AMATHDRAFT_70381 [Amanita thiersii Skay4041]
MNQDQHTTPWAGVDKYRTTQAIVWSCLSTMFLCTWVALHPDVLDSSHRRFRYWWYRGVKRAGLTLVALIAPEYILLDAYGTWRNACNMVQEIHDMFPDCQWTEVHTQFVCMGGFRLVRVDRTSYQLEEHWFLCELSRGSIDLPEVTEKGILDKSKGDVVSKGVTMVQTTYFVLQCIHRAARGLVVTELELTAVAHTLFSVMIYFFWWNKPLNVEVPIEVHEKSLPWIAPPSSPAGGSSVHAEDVNLLTGQCKRQLSLRVRMGLGCYNASGTAVDFLRFTLIFFLGRLFGAVHCLAWNTHFPTRAASIVWRVSVLMVTFCPFISYVIPHIRWIHIGSVYVIFAVYCVARVCLLVLSFYSLQSLPFDAHVALSWTSYLLHF